MKRSAYTVRINASKEKIWEILWNDKTYREWTSVFSPGSYAESEWEEGSKILFLSPEGSGMYSVIEKMTPNEYMSFKHIGVVKDMKEQPLDDESKSWSGARENYRLKEVEGKTDLTVELDLVDEHASFFEETFPKALQKVKELSEK